VCKDYADRIFGSDPTRYDGCGLRLKDGVIVPSTQFSDATEFLNGIKPPMLEDFTFEIVDGEEGLFATYDHRN
jgi:hypothetical protein